MSAAPRTAESWTPGDWMDWPAAQQPDYPDRALLADVERELGRSAPIARIADCAALRATTARIADGRGFILQGGDCAETVGAGQEQAVPALVSLFERLAERFTERPVTIGRVAGQFAKPRSSPTETRGLLTLPAYRGDSINGSAFTAAARGPDPRRMIAAHAQAVEAAAMLDTASPGRSRLFTSHEALLLPYEQALARQGEDGQWWATSGHMLWVGDRTRQVDGAHIAFLSGIANLVGVKCGPSLGADQMLRLLDRLDPENQAGKVALIGRFGAGSIGKCLPPLMRAAKHEGRQVLWMIDPMHGNSRIEGATKVRRLEDITAETRHFFDIAGAEGVHPAGLHIEMTPAEVTECIGESETTEQMAMNFQSLCDPRLNAAQAQQLVQVVADLVDRLAPVGA